MMLITGKQNKQQKNSSSSFARFKKLVTSGLLPEQMFLIMADISVFVWRMFFFVRSTRAKLNEVSRLTEENLAGVEPERLARSLDRIAKITDDLRKQKV